MHPRNFSISRKTPNSTAAPRSILRGDPPTIGKIPKFKSRDNLDAKPGKLEFTIEGDQIMPGSWCSNCRNGGEVVVCVICGINSICTTCINFEIDQIDSGEIQLECPGCFIKKDKDRKYPFKIQGSSSTRQHWPTVIITPIAIISIHLEGMKDTPSILTYHHLHPWLQGNIVHVSFDFNFERFDNDVKVRLNSMLDRFESGDLKSFSRFFIFITTHSDPNTGFQHIAPRNLGSIPVGEFLDFFIPGRFQEILKRSESNILNLLSCGALSTHEDSRKEMAKFARRKLFSRILGFSQPDFQPFFAHHFVMELGLQHFIYNRPSLAPILRDQQELGAHTDVIDFQPGQITTFRWTHPGARPMGSRFVNQCSSCQRLKTLKPTDGKDRRQITLKCSFCNNATQFTLPPEWDWVNGIPVKGEERGAWIVCKDIQGDEAIMDTT